MKRILPFLLCFCLVCVLCTSAGAAKWITTCAHVPARGGRRACGTTTGAASFPGGALG